MNKKDLKEKLIKEYEVKVAEKTRKIQAIKDFHVTVIAGEETQKEELSLYLEALKKLP